MPPLDVNSVQKINNDRMNKIEEIADLINFEDMPKEGFNHIHQASKYIRQWEARASALFFGIGILCLIYVFLLNTQYVYLYHIR